MQDTSFKSRLKAAWNILRKKKPIPEIHRFTFISHVKLSKEWKLYKAELVFDYADNWYLEKVTILHNEKEKSSLFKGKVANVAVFQDSRLDAFYSLLST